MFIGLFCVLFFSPFLFTFSYFNFFSIGLVDTFGSHTKIPIWVCTLEIIDYKHSSSRRVTFYKELATSFILRDGRSYDNSVYVPMEMFVFCDQMQSLLLKGCNGG
jgi:hypothetical protein